MKYKKALENIVMIKWEDSYGVETGWRNISDYSADSLIINSVGKIIYEDNKVISLAHNFASETNNTPMQANGIMVIPKACIVEIISFSSCQVLASKQKQQQI